MGYVLANLIIGVALVLWAIDLLKYKLIKNISIFILRIAVVIPLTICMVFLIIILIPLSPFIFVYQKLFNNDG